MIIQIEEHNIKNFKKFCKRADIKIKDKQDLQDRLNKFIEQNLDFQREVGQEGI